jgi:ribose transport system substrate-binding protein
MVKTKILRACLLGSGLLLLAALGILAPRTGAAEVKAKLSIGIVNFDGASFTSNSFAVALQKAARKIGWHASIQDPRGDLSQANAFCTQFVTRRVDVIVVNVFESSQMAQCMAYARQASIPVFYLATSLSPGMAGAISAVNAKPMNDAFLSYAGKTPELQALTLTYNPGAPCRIRQEDLESALAKVGGSTRLDKHEITVPGQVTSALAATQAWLNGHPADRKQDLAIWACFSEPAIGAVSAIKQAGRSGIPIFTWDLDKQTITALKAGEITATLWVDADGMAQQMISQIKDHEAGAPPREDEATSVVVTPQNIGPFLMQHPTGGG